jgi:hypothetical protein
VAAGSAQSDARRDTTSQEDAIGKGAVTIIDADGVFIEVDGADKLRSAFERVLFDRALSPDQVLTVWQINTPAREAIAEVFGANALDAAAERIKCAEAARGWYAAGEKARRRDQWDLANGDSDTRAPAQPDRQPVGPSLALPDLSVAIDPSWGDRRVFRHYWQRLAAVQSKGSFGNADIARFRAANAAVETRLRTKLPQLAKQIDAAYPIAAPYSPQRLR